ncbi:MAG: AbrB/MazE/SpoVT family DNA-binding domain-containing protein [Pseudomonadota bacterium]
MGIVDSKTFKSGNSVAVRLPKDVAFAPDIRVTIERNGDVLTIRPAHDPVAEREAVDQFLADMLAIGAPDDGVQKRPPFEWIDRPGL